MEDEGQSVCVSSRARYEYMNMVTDLYGKNFHLRKIQQTPYQTAPYNVPNEAYKLCQERTVSRARYEYMNMVTDLYGKNFCGQVGEWCDRHNAAGSLDLEILLGGRHEGQTS